MTLQNLFLLLVPTYLVLIAYRVVGLRRRAVSPNVRWLAIGLLVLIPPVAVLAALYGTGDAFLIAGWGIVAVAMLACGVVTAVLAWFIAARVA